MDTDAMETGCSAGSHAADVDAPAAAAASEPAAQEGSHEEAAVSEGTIGAGAGAGAAAAEDAPRLSKNALKRLRRDAKWDAEVQNRREKRKAKRQRDKEIKRARKEAGEVVPPKLRPGRRGVGGPEKSPQRVAIDLDFDKYHQIADIKKLMKQVQTSYAANRRAKKALTFHLTSMQGVCKQRHEAVDGDKWDVVVSEKPYHETFAKDEIVYLSSESENVLETFDESKVYIIGGLVDHNRFKGLTHKMALERGMAHARLPIQENFKLESRTVLTVNHVFEILLHFLNDNDWSTAIRSVIPKRKGLKELQEEAGERDEKVVCDDKEGDKGTADSNTDSAVESAAPAPDAPA